MKESLGQAHFSAPKSLIGSGDTLRKTGCRIELIEDIINVDENLYPILLKDQVSMFELTKLLVGHIRDEDFVLPDSQPTSGLNAVEHPIVQPSSENEWPRLITSGIVAVGVSMILGIDGWIGFAFTCVCFAVVAWIWGLVLGD